MSVPDPFEAPRADTPRPDAPYAGMTLRRAARWTVGLMAAMLATDLLAWSLRLHDLGLISALLRVGLLGTGLLMWAVAPFSALLRGIRHGEARDLALTGLVFVTSAVISFAVLAAVHP